MANWIRLIDTLKKLCFNQHLILLNNIKLENRRVHFHSNRTIRNHKTNTWREYRPDWSWQLGRILETQQQFGSNPQRNLHRTHWIGIFVCEIKFFFGSGRLTDILIQFKKNYHARMHRGTRYQRSENYTGDPTMQTSHLHFAYTKSNLLMWVLTQNSSPTLCFSFNHPGIA